MHLHGFAGLLAGGHLLADDCSKTFTSLPNRDTKHLEIVAEHCRSYPSLTRKNSMPHRQYPKLLQSGCTLHLGQQEAVLSKRGITIFCLKLRLKNLSLATVRISISAVAGHALKTRDSRQARCWCWSSAKLPCVCTRLAYTEKTLARKLEV